MLTSRATPEAQRGDSPVSISTSNGGTGATLVWRWQGQLYVTAVVKATFALVPGGAMTQVQPEPIARDEHEYEAGLRTAGDLVPFRRRAEVVITGHAFVSSGPPGASVPVRFSVIRDGAAVIDRSIALQVPAGAPAGRVRLFGLGPLSRHWPVRRRLLGVHDPQRFEGAAIDLPAGFDESYFQAAPLEQRLDRLRGDEQIAVEGARADGVRLETRLPGVRVVARIYGPPEPGDARPFDLVMDTLHVDLDQGVCNVTWRGVTQVAREDEVGALRVVAVVELSGRSLAPAARPPNDLLASTVFLGGEGLPTMMLSPDLDVPPPVEGSLPSPADFGRTRAVDSDAVPASSAVLPFEPGPAPEAPSRWIRPPQAVLTTGTLGLSVEDEIDVAARPAVPFPGAAPNPPVPQLPSWRSPSAATPMPVVVTASPPAAIPPLPVARIPSVPAADAKDADISLERCAAIAAELAERRSPRAAVLAAAGVGELTWSGAERLWNQVVDRDVGLGRSALRDAYDAAYVAAWEKIRGPLRPADYASLRAAPPTRLGAALEAAGIRRTVWPRVQRVWKRRLEQDPALAEAVADASRALGEPAR